MKNTRQAQGFSECLQNHSYDSTPVVEYEDGNEETFWLKHPRGITPPVQITRQQLVQAFISADPNATLTELYAKVVTLSRRSA